MSDGSDSNGLVAAVSAGGAVASTEAGGAPTLWPVSSTGGGDVDVATLVDETGHSHELMNEEADVMAPVPMLLVAAASALYEAFVSDDAGNCNGDGAAPTPSCISTARPLLPFARCNARDSATNDALLAAESMGRCGGEGYDTARRSRSGANRFDIILSTALSMDLNSI